MLQILRLHKKFDGEDDRPWSERPQGPRSAARRGTGGWHERKQRRPSGQREAWQRCALGGAQADAKSVLRTRVESAEEQLAGGASGVG